MPYLENLSVYNETEAKTEVLSLKDSTAHTTERTLYGSITNNMNSATLSTLRTYRVCALSENGTGSVETDSYSFPKGAKIGDLCYYADAQADTEATLTIIDHTTGKPSFYGKITTQPEVSSVWHEAASGSSSKLIGGSAELLGQLSAAGTVGEAYANVSYNDSLITAMVKIEDFKPSEGNKEYTVSIPLSSYPEGYDHPADYYVPYFYTFAELGDGVECILGGLAKVNLTDSALSISFHLLNSDSNYYQLNFNYIAVKSN